MGRSLHKSEGGSEDGMISSKLRMVRGLEGKILSLGLRRGNLSVLRYSVTESPREGVYRPGSA
jgi:hypothetical protein